LKVVIHQPNYFPYSGFFHKLSLADTFVMMDDTQYDKKFTNRNRIIVPNGWIWITVPIKKEQKFQSNKLIEINNNLDWKKTHWQKIQRSYSNAKFFNLYKDYFDSLYKKEWDLLFELNYETLTKTIEWLDLKIEIIKESELNVSGNSTDRLVNICKSVGAETYVSGIGGKEYMNENIFEKNKIKLEYQQFLHPEYPQHFSETFIPNLSIIDLLVNMGSDSLKFLSGQNVN
jgi:hypothetical protein